MRPAATARRADGGFTLFEVLAAVAILGVLFVVLANIAIDAMRFEGEASRRLRAALLADRVLGDIERGFALGSAPPVGTTESEENGFQVVAEVRPFDLAGFAATLADPQPTGAQAPGQGPPPLLEIEVVVGWIEGSTPLEIRRLTYGFDLTAAQGALEAIAPAEEETGTDGEGAGLDPRITLQQGDGG